MTEKLNVLGEFLRARRELITPGEAGVPSGGNRRVPGLRREEVAMLAGISADYYLRLEKGRDRNPSRQVLEAIARVLQLDRAHLAHLLSLVSENSKKPRSRSHEEEIPPGVLHLMHSLTQPAYLEGRYFDILASNRAARALSPGFAPGRNLLRDMFLDPAVQANFPDWEVASECFVANLRQAVGTDIDDSRFIELTGELSLASPQFCRLWARHEVRGQSGVAMRIANPEVGELTLNRERLAVAGTENIMLVVYHAVAGTADADKLTLLSSANYSPTRPVLEKPKKSERSA
ncbi:helix-turn-helix transcriptional regulator [Streptomyces sp. NPDC049916]|uniref:helix-turn-helix transcriptional regulator n=1 Tax=Streptomyces sp. NPDC049916 TaxID=3155156 RepID=UPI00342E3593